jgi:NAD(P)-dependent dehydrogenase (short-subunit alcohol dehydrogenase family)
VTGADEAGEPELPDEVLGRAPGRGRLTGRRVLVVGAGTRHSDDPEAPIGNGRAISVLAAREGATVVCVDRHEAAPRRPSGSSRRRRERASAPGAARAGVRCSGRCERRGGCAGAVDAAVGLLGGLDGLVLNVGIALGRGLTGTTAEEWDRVFAVNVRAHFLVTAAALGHLAPRSSIVFVSSAASLPLGHRGAVVRLLQGSAAGPGPQTAREAARSRSRANVLVPGYVDTPMGREASARNPNRARRLPLGRQATAWEVAYGAVWLLSHESSYMTASRSCSTAGCRRCPDPAG